MCKKESGAESRAKMKFTDATDVWIHVYSDSGSFKVEVTSPYGAALSTALLRGQELLKASRRAG